jgi:hypothetical protein
MRIHIALDFTLNTQVCLVVYTKVKFFRTVRSVIALASSASLVSQLLRHCSTMLKLRIRETAQNGCAYTAVTDAMNVTATTKPRACASSYRQCKDYAEHIAQQ